MRNIAVALIAVLIFSPSLALALDVSSTSSRSLVDCNDLAQGARDAQLRYVQTYQPRQDPGKTFDDAVSSCLDFITGFQISIPSMWDGILSSMTKQLMQRGCQAARGQFDKAVGDAMQSVSGIAGQVPGVGIRTGGSGVSVQGDNGTLMKNTANTAVDRVINIIK